MTSRAKLALSLCLCPIILIAIFIATAAPAHALTPDYPSSRYIHTSWGNDYGLDSVRRLAQTPDGYLWLATSSGLVRFDGVRFTRYARADGQSLDNSVPLMVDTDGSLWVGTYGGVIAHLQSGKFHAYSSQDGLPSEYIETLLRDSQGVLWVGTRGHGIFRMMHDRFEKVSLDIPPNAHITRFAEDLDHALWITTFGNGVYRLQNGSLHAFSVGDGLPNARVAALCRDHRGTIWTAGVNGISAWNGTRFVAEPEVNSLVSYGFAATCTEDRDQNLWIASWPGLFRLRAGKVTKVDANSGLNADYLEDVFEDREGNIWAATNRGLDRFRQAQVRTLTRRDGLFNETTAIKWPIVADRSDGVWIASGKQVVRITANKITASPIGLPSGSETHTMLLEHGSGLLAGLDKGLKHWSPAHAALTQELEDLDVRCLFRARDGSLWIATANRGLLHWESYPRPEARFDPIVQDKSVVTLTQDRDGTIWAGSHGGGLYRIVGQQVQNFGQADGLRSSNVYTVFIDRKGALWIGTAGGLSWFEHGRIRTVGAEQGLRSDLVVALLDDSWDRLWFLSHSVIASIEKKSLTEWAEGRLPKLNPTYYQNADGWQEWTAERTFPDAVQSVDGHLWFAIADGFAEVTPPDPRLSHKLEFPVIVEDVTIDGISHSEPNRIQIPPGAHSVEIRYTALTLSRSDTIHFRYRLEGVDDHWVDADARRIAIYNNLKPGTYTFKTEASAVEDQWLAAPPLSLLQIPFFYQTNWFFALCVAVSLFILWAFYRMRVRQVAQVISVRFNERLSERTRLARDLHDTLLQSIQASKYIADASIRRSTADSPMRGSMEELSEWLGQAIEEGRAAVNALRSSAIETNDLAAAFRLAIEECREQSSIEFSFSVIGEVSELHPIARDEVYRIGYEAIRNACAHSQATHLQVELTYAEDLILRVIDNGVGIDPAIVCEGKQGHFGLRGMRERANRIMATLRVETSPASGTAIKLIVLGNSLYGRPASGGRKRSSIKSLLDRMGLTSNSTDV